MPSSRKNKKSAATISPPNTALVGIRPDSIKGCDDMGNFYNSHSELEEVQSRNRASWYDTNKQWWVDGGYGGLTDDEAMIGDGNSHQDCEEGLAFLDRLISSRPSGGLSNAIDAGAGVGRITKNILLKRFGQVNLIEGDVAISKRSRSYLGRKRSDRCTFTCCRLEELREQDFVF